jgi:Zn-dependent M28 family amino/carboxypeptidase
MTGDASNGITMVNGEANPTEHTLMDKINGQKSYVPKINKREQTQNSDHWPFCEQGVKGVFIYANGDGSNPYYHDVFDKAHALSLKNVDGLAKLLIDFTTELAKGK